MFEIQAENREVFGKNLESFRKKGKLPAVLYGPKQETRPIFILLKDFKKLWDEAGESTVIQLNLGDTKKEVLIQDVAMDPVKREPVHVDFYAVLMDKPLQASVSLIFEGISHAVKNLGGILVKVMHEIEVEALPKNLPHELGVDISALAHFEDKILAKAVILPKGVKLISNPDETIALIEAPRAEEAPASEEKIAFEEIEVVGKKEKGEEEKAAEETEK